MSNFLRFGDIKHFVFDFDGTLVESNGIKEALFFRIASQVPNGEKTMAAIYQKTGLTRQEIWMHWTSEMGLNMLQYNRFLNEYSKDIDDQVIKAPAVEGAIELLQHLKSNSIKASLSSATPEKSLKDIISRRGWAQFFAGVYGSPKRKEETLREVMLSFALTPKLVAVVGDGEDDRLSAETIGCHFFPVGRLQRNLPFEEQYDLIKIRTLLSCGAYG